MKLLGWTKWKATLKQGFLKHRLKLALLGALSVAFSLGTLPSPVIANESPSLPLGFYLTIPGTPRDGDIVAYHPQKKVTEMAQKRGYLPKNTQEQPIFVKHILQAGAFFTTVKKSSGALEFWAIPKDYEPVRIGEVAKADAIGEELPSIGTGIVETGHFLPYGDGKNSFDGRYTGTEDEHAIVSRVVPILVIPL